MLVWPALPEEDRPIGTSPVDVPAPEPLGRRVEDSGTPVGLELD